MSRLIDLVGRRVGHLLVLHIDPERVGAQGKQYWVCKCECGNAVSVIGQSLRRGTATSCGCLYRERMDAWHNRPKHKKLCVICGALYECPPSTKRLTCSEACRTTLRSRAQRESVRTWSSDARRRKAARGQDDNLKHGTPAAKASPLSGPYETNVHAKVWTLIDPSGKTHHVRNLSLFCREHAAEYDATPTQMIAGISAIRQWQTGTRKRQVSSWKGWGLLPEE